ncbi:unnamed protein product, partial [Thlaspi arvense]
WSEEKERLGVKRANVRRGCSLRRNEWLSIKQLYSNPKAPGFKDWLNPPELSMEMKRFSGPRKYVQAPAKDLVCHNHSSLYRQK